MDIANFFPDAGHSTESTYLYGGHYSFIHKKLHNKQNADNAMQLLSLENARGQVR